jgi:hypothetical protein
MESAASHVLAEMRCPALFSVIERKGRNEHTLSREFHTRTVVLLAALWCYRAYLE